MKIFKFLRNIKRRKKNLNKKNFAAPQINNRQLIKILSMKDAASFKK